jgi:predicted nuclease of predicted toxin-antitoxin system
LKEESLSDEEILARARIANAVVITKDYDFVNLVTARGAPPQVIVDRKLHEQGSHRNSAQKFWRSTEIDS